MTPSILAAIGTFLLSFGIGLYLDRTVSIAWIPIILGATILGAVWGCR